MDIAATTHHPDRKIQHFKYSNMIEIHDKAMFVFYPGLPHMHTTISLSQVREVFCNILLWLNTKVTYWISIYILPEQDISINVSYIPPPGTELALNRYRAASGPVAKCHLFSSKGYF